VLAFDLVNDFGQPGLDLRQGKRRHDPDSSHDQAPPSARGEADEASDLDVVLVRPTDVGEEDERWIASVEAFRTAGRRLTGSPVQVLEVARSDISRHLRSNKPLWVDAGYNQAMAVLFTIGHGTRSLAELVDMLGQAGVTDLADVRRHPGSRRNPHLGQPAMAAALPGYGLAYEWWGEELGGRRSAVPASRHPAWRNASFRAYADHMDSPAFRQTFARLLEEAVTRPTAVMCAETLWWRCHRRLLADAAVLRGWEVVHLMGDGQRRPHVPNPAMRADEAGWPVYDLPTPEDDA
jgi:hypothetical protein